MKKTYIPVALLLLSLTSCYEVVEYTNDPRGNFECLWTTIDEHYCFLDEKFVNWDSIHEVYSRRISDEMTSQELFNVCAAMTDELRDGHTNLSAPFNTSYYTRWWSDYPQNYDERLVQQYYFNFNYLNIGSIYYGLLSENIGYIRYPSFASGIGAGNLDYVLSYFSTATGLIIDIRDNGGGSMTNVEDLVARFIDRPTLAGYISHKTGPGHDDFSSPRPYHYNPAQIGHLRWGKPVVVLANRGTFSAANNFVSIMKYLPNCRIVGSTTGGGSGMPFNYELPNGWGIRFAACSVLDPGGNTTEFGVEPSEGCAVDLDPEAALRGHDTILDFAVDLLQK